MVAYDFEVVAATSGRGGAIPGFCPPQGSFLKNSLHLKFPVTIDTESSAQLVEARERRHANESLRGEPVPEMVALADLCVAPSDRPGGGREETTWILSFREVTFGFLFNFQVKETFFSPNAKIFTSLVAFWPGLVLLLVQEAGV